MRIYTDFIQAKNEIARDLNELGVTVFAGYQGMSHDKLDREAFTTKELQGYDYRVVNPQPHDLAPTQPWADAEWEERLWGCRGNPVNPGEAWKLRPDVWTPLVEADGKFSYTYSERLAVSFEPAMFEMYEHPTSRQAYVPIWDPTKDGRNMGHRRVPCSLGYHFMYRQGAVHLVYTMRSSDFATHFDNDLYLAMRLLQYFCERIDQPVGTLTHVIYSLHTYARNVAGIF